MRSGPHSDVRWSASVNEGIELRFIQIGMVLHSKNTRVLEFEGETCGMERDDVEESLPSRAVDMERT